MPLDNNTTTKLHPGDYVIYMCGTRCQIGKVKRIDDKGCVFVYYHEGDTASRTPKEYLHRIENSYVILESSLGGNT